MDIDISSYKKNGYLFLKDFLSEIEVKKILNDAKKVFYRQFLEKNYINNVSFEKLKEVDFNTALFKLYNEDIECLVNCGKQVQHLISLHSLSLQKKIIDLLKELGINEPNISTRPVLFFNHPKLAKEKVYYKVDAHQDWRSMQGSLNSIIIWLPLIDVSKELGALEILPGSHLDSLRTNKIVKGFGMVNLTEEEEEKMLSVEVEVGDILVFSSFLIHRSGENISDSPRWSCHFRYNDLEEETFIKRKYAHSYIYKPIEELITDNFPTKEEVAKIYS